MIEVVDGAKIVYNIGQWEKIKTPCLYKRVKVYL